LSWFFELTRRVERRAPRVFVETGTFRGDCAAREAAWFRHVFTIELDPELAEAARKRFADEPNVEVIEGDSGEVLPFLIARPELQEPALFYLDGHWSGGITARGRLDEDGCPLLREMEALGHRSFADIIVIDDARLFGKKTVSGTGGDWPPTEFDWRHITEESLVRAYGRECEVKMAEDVDRLILLPVPV